ncbi:acetate--CoA ligase [Desulfolutivibrio sulfoxidireducens]|uniref:acetate--CoA ligase n=1 Tax=Desulfolutivibrio sulfoxidireducens TaxID=2773299 RepID=UPI00159E3A9D|nr:acetate--CoA ligase [Desulfolutivibrio sulfoxidireducens]QLA16319.1 acetate--CoA ligase [Desulfolutivibrio sulfoxidireducens]QLA19790.1 acetate--CoA ligase [Desulfolutivibrio sulfoxidireducens]
MEQDGTLDALLVEKRVLRPLPRQIMEANLSPSEFETVRLRATNDPLAVWAEAATKLVWSTPFDRVLDEENAPFYRWFPGGRTNIAANALDRHVESDNRNKLALVFEYASGEVKKYTYFELHREVCRFAAALRNLGLSRGDRMVIHMPTLPETVVGMLAAARIGAVHCLVHPGFSAKALARRIEDCRARLVLTADGAPQGDRIMPVKPLVDEALAGSGGTGVESVVVVRHTGQRVGMLEGRDLYYHDLVARERTPVAPEPMESGDELFVLHGSGGSAKPRGIVHGHGGYMVGLWRTITWVLDVKPTDVVWCTADPAWITGHGYAVYGPLLAGATTVMTEGNTLANHGARFFDIIDRHGVTILYTTPTLLRMMRRMGVAPAREHDLTSLRLLATAGEPVLPEVWVWFHKTVGLGQCPLLDTWWQTETGMIMLSPLPISLLMPGSVGRPLPGISADVVDAAGQPVPPGKGGYLVIKRPWPGMLLTLDGDPGGYRNLYWEKIPGMFFTGDMARKDEDGYFWIQGRADDVLQLGGQRIGNAEIEGALASHAALAEAAVIGVPDAMGGLSAKAFLVPVAGWEERFDSEEELVRDVKAHLRRELGPVAEVRFFAVRGSLPKTPSGKISRKSLRDEETR